MSAFDFHDLKFNIEFKNISYNKFYAKSITAENKNKIIEIQSDVIKISQTSLSNFLITLQNNKFDFSCLMQSKHKLKANGILSNNLKKITINNGTIVAEKNTINFDGTILDFIQKSYNINILISNHKLNSLCKIDLNSNYCNVVFSGIHLRDFSEIIGQSWRGIINGNIKLKNSSGVFVGHGDLNLSHVLASNCETNISLNFQRDMIVANSILSNRGDGVKIDLSLPFVLKNGFNLQETNAKLSAHIYGKNKLENFFELPDKSNLQGDFECDYCFSGTIKKPVISGSLKIKNMLISINSVLLSNGSLELVGDSDCVRVVSAKFIDRNKNIATATGYARLFFDKFIPNIDVNLDLNFKKFFVLDSDSLKIQATGKCQMIGPLNDLKLVGEIDVPYAEIANFQSQDEVENSKINFENDSALQKKKDNSSKDSFLTYDILMHGRKINVIGNVYELLLKGDLKLTMYEKKDTLVGMLNLVDGKIDLFGKRMKFVKGQIEFIDKYPYNPKVDLLCRKNFGNLLVSFEVKNTPKKGGLFHLYSNPSYSQDVILSQMMFNKDTKSLSAGEAAQLVNAVSSLKNQGYLFSMLNAFTNIGLLDNISFSSDDGRYTSSLNKNLQSSNQQINVSAGKYLQDNVYVSLNKKNEKTTFDIDLSLSPTTSVKANTAGELGLNWKYRY